MQIIAKTLKNAPNRAEIKKLYYSSFPKEELLPWLALKLLTVRRGADIWGYYENETFCGFTYTACYNGIVYLMFFAVNESLRGKGYGSAILEYLKKTNPDKRITLNVEPIDENTENAEERVKRIDFYKKNGFFDTGHNIKEVGGTFRVMSTSPEFDPEAYVGVFKKISFGTWVPKITKID